MKKHHFCLRFLSYLLALSILCTLLFGIAQATNLKSEVNASLPQSFSSTKTVVLDAGHGGEDGGASSADGVLEKDLNLALALTMRDILLANGVNVILTR